MKISLNYLKKYLDFDLPELELLVKTIEARLGALEEPPLNLSELYSDALVVKVVDCQLIKDSDHLSICLIDDGKVRQDIERNDQGLISVVCGAPNVSSGLTTAWLPPGSIVPSTLHHEPLRLDSRQLRGYLSQGMLASPRELDLYDDHQGILELPGDIKPGSLIKDVFDLDDIVINIENKMFTHRPDCFGLLGLSREVSGISHHLFKSPDWYLNPATPKKEAQLDVGLTNEIPSLVPRFSIVAVEAVKVQPSPMAIQSYLARMGIRPVNNLVDLANLVMLETAQPLHIYDYHKLEQLAGGQPTLTVRNCRPNESIQLINGREVKPSAETIVIAVGDQLVGIGGVMGGQNSEVDENTTAIVIEVASFDMYSIRRTSMDLGLFSDAVTRLTKGQSPLQTYRVLSYKLTKLKELMPEAQIASEIIDDCHLDKTVLETDSLHPAITITASFINKRLGLELKASEIAELLTNVECQVEVNDQELNVKAPFWRTDLEIREDIVEEVGRLYGYENISPRAPYRLTSPTQLNPSFALNAQLRNRLSAAGASELLSYSFVSERLITNASQSASRAYTLANFLSPELKHYRLSLTPSLLSKIRPNIKLGIDTFALFEIGSYHLNDGLDDQSGLPVEYPSLALVYTSKQPQSGSAYFRARYFLNYLLTSFKLDGVSFLPLGQITKLDSHLEELSKPFDPERSAIIVKNDKQYGVVGEYSPRVAANLKLPSYSAGFEIVRDLFDQVDRSSAYRQLSKYPSLKQDITFSVPKDMVFKELDDFLRSELGSLVGPDSHYSWRLTSIFQQSDIHDIHYSFHLEITDYQRTLNDQEVNNLLAKLSLSAEQAHKIKRV